MARKRIIAGNWKMNKTPSEAVALVNELKDLVKNDAVDVVYCVPAIDIVPVVEAVKGTNVAVGAENMYFEESGAYTGEISAAMLVIHQRRNMLFFCLSGYQVDHDIGDDSHSDSLRDAVHKRHCDHCHISRDCLGIILEVYLKDRGQHQKSYHDQGRCRPWPDGST